jgi:hypothetical protein
VLGDHPRVMPFVHFPQRPDTLTADFASARYEELGQRSLEAEASPSPEGWLALFRDWNALRSYVLSEEFRLSTGYMNTRTHRRTSGTVAGRPCMMTTCPASTGLAKGNLFGRAAGTPRSTFFAYPSTSSTTPSPRPAPCSSPGSHTLTPKALWPGTSRLCRLGGTRSVLELFAAAGLRSPFDPEVTSDLAEHVRNVLRSARGAG